MGRACTDIVREGFTDAHAEEDYVQGRGPRNDDLDSPMCGFGFGDIDDHDMSPLSASTSASPPDEDLVWEHFPSEASSSPVCIAEAWTDSTTAPTCARTENVDTHLRDLHSEDGGNDDDSSVSSDVPVLAHASGKPAKCKSGFTGKASSRKHWTPEEEGRFLKALERFGPKEVETDPNTGRVSVRLGPGVSELISMVVGTRSVTQVRSHVQKHFIRMEREAARGKAVVGHGTGPRTG